MRNHFIVFIIIFLVLSIFTRSSLYAYSASKHHKFMGEMASEESTLDEYLKNNLGFSGGINTKLTNPDEPTGEQTKTIKEWIGYGGIVEDKGFVFPLPRVARHFYDPVSNQGLNDHSPPVISSLEWGREQNGGDDDYSWTRAREYYYLALTSPAKEERERYWALTFRSLGQVLHLVQDLASPSHVRNDNHLSKVDDDPYESIWGTSPEGISFIHAILAHGALGNPDYQYPAVQLDRFEDYWDTEDGQGLAEFTNSNFVSKDTNLDRLAGDPHHYDNPQATGEHRESFTFTDSTGRTRTIGVNYVTSNVIDNYAPGRSVNPFNYLTTNSYFNFYTERYDLTKKSYTLNRKCHEEYAKLLVPRTVGYGAGLLNYFFRGKIDASFQLLLDEDNWYNYIINISNKSDDLILDGSLEIYYHDDSAIYIDVGNIPIIDSTYSSIEGLRPDESCTVTIDAYPSYAKYLIVFRGCTLGDEDNVTIGKVVRQNIFFQDYDSARAKKEISDMRRYLWSINYNDVLLDNPYYLYTAQFLSIGQVYQTYTTGTNEHFERYIIYRSYPKFFTTSSIPDEAEIRSVRYYMNIYGADSESLPWTLQIYKCNEATWGAGTDIIATMPAVSLISQPQKIINITPSAINKEGRTIFEMKCSTENAPFNGTQLEPNEEEVISIHNLERPYNYLLIEWDED